MRSLIAAILLLILSLSIAQRVAAEGEAVNGYPNWSERVLLEWMNRARSDPQADLAACPSGNCLESACYTAAATPRHMNYSLDHSSRFHSDHMRLNGYFDHPSHCTLVSNIAALYPTTCSGAASCSCIQGQLTTDQTTWTDPFNRMAEFGASVSSASEIIAAGYGGPNATFYAWLYEPATTSTCGMSSDDANGHRYLILTTANVGPETGAGYVTGPGTYQSYASMDMAGSTGNTYKIPSGSHYPQQAASVDAWANWYDTSGPTVAKIDVDGVCSDMTLQRGSTSNGAWHQSVSNVGTGCHRYLFAFKDSGGNAVIYPTSGSLAIGPSDGTCPDWTASAPPLCAGFTQTFTVTPSVGANGSVTPATSQSIAMGASASFTVTPQSGYVASVGGTCGGSLSGNIYTTTPVNFSCSVNFKFVTGALTAPLAVWRPGTAIWYVRQASGATSATQWGLPGDIPFYVDVNGDGVNDLVVWRPSNGTWYERTSTTASTSIQFGLPGDVPMASNGWSVQFGGTGISYSASPIAVWRPSNAVWYFSQANINGNIQAAAVQLGLPNDIPLARSYGTASNSKGVFRPSTGVWYVDGVPSTQQWGLPGDVPVSGDYDGDAIPDFAVWRSSNGNWYIIPSSASSTPIVVQFGLPGDIPVPYDYDGDGKTDIAVWRPSSGTWYIRPSSRPSVTIVVQWGLNGDMPSYSPVGMSH